MYAAACLNRRSSRHLHHEPMDFNHGGYISYVSRLKKSCMCMSQYLCPNNTLGLSQHDVLQPRSPEQVIATLAEYLHTDALCCRETDGPVADLQALVRCTCLQTLAVEPSLSVHKDECICRSIPRWLVYVSLSAPA